MTDVPRAAPGFGSSAGLAAVARVAPLAVQLIATPFVLASIGPGQFAVWALLATTINLILTADLGVVGIMQRYHGIARGSGDSALGGRITATVIGVLVVLLVVVTILGPVIADAAMAVVNVEPSTEATARFVFQNAGTLAVLQLLGLAFSSYLAAHERYAAMAAASLSARSLYAVAIAVALATGHGLTGLVVAVYVDALAAVILGLVFCRVHLVREVRRMVTRSELGSLWAYAWRNQASALGFVAQRESDVVLAAVLLPAVLQATVASSAQLAAALSLAPTVLLVPLFSRLSASAGRAQQEAVDDGRRAQTAWLSAALPFAAIVLSVMPGFALAWLGPDLPDLVVVITVLTAGFLIVLANSVVVIVLRAIGRPGFETASYAFLLVVKLAVAIPATLLFGVVGLAASTVVASVASVVALGLLTRRLLPGYWRRHVTARVMVAAAAVLAIGVPADILIMNALDNRIVQLVVLAVLSAALVAVAALVILGRARLVRMLSRATDQ